MFRMELNYLELQYYNIKLFLIHPVLRDALDLNRDNDGMMAWLAFFNSLGATLSESHALSALSFITTFS